MATTSALDDVLSQELWDFYASHNVDVSGLMRYASSDCEVEKKRSPFLYRFIRLNPRFSAEETLTLLKKEIAEQDVIRVPWLPDDAYYALPGDFSLSSSSCFHSGRIYGMDVSSGAAIAVLLSNRYDKTSTDPACPSETTEEHSAAGPWKVLDLCCCPGLKLCAIADRVLAGSTVIGVDVSRDRMALCSKIIQKYHIDHETSRGKSEPDECDVSGNVRIQLFCQDGTTFAMAGIDHNLIFDSRVANEDAGVRGTRKRKNKSARAREKKRLKLVVSEEMTIGEKTNSDPSTLDDKNSNIIQQNATALRTSDDSLFLFDRVLVDAECSTDGSLKHLRERLKDDASKAHQHQQSNATLTDTQKLAELVDLQRRLIASGYRLLKSGGILVYSTCSLSRDQNECIVRWLLDQHQDAYLIPVEFRDTRGNDLVQEGSLAGTIRFYPNLGQDPDALFGDGFYVAKIGKR